MTPELTPVEGAGRVQAAGYDSASQMLSVRFKNSNYLYRYPDIDADKAADFNAAESKGSWVHANLVKPGHPFEKIDLGDDA